MTVLRRSFLHSSLQYTRQFLSGLALGAATTTTCRLQPSTWCSWCPGCYPNASGPGCTTMARADEQRTRSNVIVASAALCLGAHGFPPLGAKPGGKSEVQLTRAHSTKSARAIFEFDMVERTLPGYLIPVANSSKVSQEACEG